MKPEDFRVGDQVVYAPRAGRREDGVVVATNALFVFVQYAGDFHAKATLPDDLERLTARKP